MTLTDVMLGLVVVSELLLVWQLRESTKVMRGIRADLPKLAGLSFVAQLLTAIAGYAGVKKDAIKRDNG